MKLSLNLVSFVTIMITPAVVVMDDYCPSTNPGVDVCNAGDALVTAIVADPTVPFTFSEFPEGTVIINQYAADKGVIFGAGAFIALDGANPTSPVLLCDPQYRGPIASRFVDSFGNPTTVSSFSRDVGYLNVVGAIRLEWFSPSGSILGNYTNSVGDGFEVMGGTGGNIASWRISSDGADAYAMDNFVSQPEDRASTPSPTDVATPSPTPRPTRRPTPPPTPRSTRRPTLLPTGIPAPCCTPVYAILESGRCANPCLEPPILKILLRLGFEEGECP